MSYLYKLKTLIVSRRGFLSTIALVSVFAAVFLFTPTKGAISLADNCPNAPVTPTLNYWPITYDDENTPLCSDFPAIDAALDTSDPVFSQSETDWNND